jgi:hypothetical protein
MPGEISSGGIMEEFEKGTEKHSGGETKTGEGEEEHGWLIHGRSGEN